MRSRLLSSIVVASLLGLAACVDLFHSTDFPTLCDVDASACATADAKVDVEVDSGGETDSGGPVDFCTLTVDEAAKTAERACGWLGACLGSSETNSYADCYVRALSAYDCAFNPSLRPRGETANTWNCLKSASNCDAVAQCIFKTPLPGCKNAGLYTACNEGDAPVVLNCSTGAIAVAMDPCALRGQICTKFDDSTARCTGTPAATCKTDGGMDGTCSGEFAVKCHSVGGIDADEGMDCTTVGAGRCVLSAAGPVCAPLDTPGTCTKAITTPHCTGTVVESCVDGKPVRFDCASLEQSCAAAAASALDLTTACTTTSTPCTAGPDTCDGGSVQSCRNGKLFTLSCSSVGMGDCHADGDRWAACAPP
jgi:hypothetical protein